MAGTGDGAGERSALLPRPSRLTPCLKQSKSCGRFVYENCAITISLASLLVTAALVALAYGVKMSHQDSEDSRSMQVFLYAILGVSLLGLVAAIRAHATAYAAEAHEVATVFQGRVPGLYQVRSAPARLGENIHPA